MEDCGGAGYHDCERSAFRMTTCGGCQILRPRAGCNELTDTGGCVDGDLGDSSVSSKYSEGFFCECLPGRSWPVEEREILTSWHDAAIEDGA